MIIIILAHLVIFIMLGLMFCIGGHKPEVVANGGSTACYMIDIVPCSCKHSPLLQL